MHWVAHWLLAAGCNSNSSNPFNISAGQIGIPCSTATVGQGFGNIVALIMSILGGLALIFVIVGGIKLTLSAGDPKRVASARETILYAAIGVVVALAGFAIVHFLAGATQGGH